MRYYLESDDHKLIVDLIFTKKISNILYEFHFDILTPLEEGQKKDRIKIFIKKLANNYFSSYDGLSWQYLVDQKIPDNILNVNTHLELYRGFRPSGAMLDEAGALYTKMPGRIIKVFVKEGDKVEKGQTLLILEAMKMENEIKSGQDGIIKNVRVKEGEVLEQGILLLELEN